MKAGIANAKSQGKKAVMMRIQTAHGARFVAVPFPEGVINPSPEGWAAARWLGG